MSKNSNFNKIVALKPASSYTKEAMKDIKLLSFNKDGLATPFGSYSYRIQKYPGDIDLLENFDGCCSKKEILDRLEKEIKLVVKRINSNRVHYISEFKMGLDERFKVNIGKLSEGIYTPNKNEINRKKKELYDAGLISQKTVTEINTILNQAHFFPVDYDILTKIFRKNLIIRWSKEDLLNEYVKLPGGKKMTIRQAIEFKAPIKIDVITKIDGKFVEITNFLIVSYTNKKGEIVPINLSKEQYSQELLPDYIIYQLRDEIEKLYFSDMFFNPFKGVKRMWALSRFIGDKKSIEKLLPIISGDLSLLYQIKSDIDTLINLYYKVSVPPKASILTELDKMKDRLSRIVQIGDDVLEDFDDRINTFSKTAKLDKVEILKSLKDSFNKLINKSTINVLKNIGMYPPPRHLLPDNLKYIYIKN